MYWDFILVSSIIRDNYQPELPWRVPNGSGLWVVDRGWRWQNHHCVLPGIPSGIRDKLWLRCVKSLWRERDLWNRRERDIQVMVSLHWGTSRIYNSSDKFANKCAIPHRNENMSLWTQTFLFLVRRGRSTNSVEEIRYKIYRITCSPPLGLIFFIFMQFLKNFGRVIR